ncbi:uncharacterized protein PAC_15964 [Phialocephala subalpina]|uniref:Uncharacterized protein n=1 Tax=Phialocephala subalpina TaxID=576137 RepID=A0A1L7XM17_9HELO|nr:uncharacterized protein PAC_15964 [Phialocephala subalpina]
MATPNVTLGALDLMPDNVNLTFVQRLKFEDLRKSRSSKETIDRLIHYYEATDNKFFLGRITTLLNDLKNEKLGAMSMKYDIADEDLLCITFALGAGPLTAEEARDLSELIVGDEMFQDAFVGIALVPNLSDLPGHSLAELHDQNFKDNAKGRGVPRKVALQAYGPEIVSSLKKALLDISGIGVEGYKGEDPGCPKPSLITPELPLQLKVQKEIVRKFEGHLEKLREATRENVDIGSLGLRDAFLGLDLLNRDVGEVKVALGLRHFETDIEELEALGVKEA